MVVEVGRSGDGGTLADSSRCYPRWRRVGVVVFLSLLHVIDIDIDMDMDTLTAMVMVNDGNARSTAQLFPV